MIKRTRSRKVVGRSAYQTKTSLSIGRREPPAGLGAVAQHADEEESNCNHQLAS